MCGRVEQQLMLVLPVELHEIRRDLSEHARGGQPAVNEGPAAAGGRDLATDQHLDAVGAFEDRLDAGGIGAGAYEVGGGPPAEEESDGLDQDRLPGAGLTGERG